MSVEAVQRQSIEVSLRLALERDVNLAQVRAGLAWHYKHYESEQPPDERSQYAEAEDVASFNRIGLWRDPMPIPPWDFRRKKRME